MMKQRTKTFSLSFFLLAALPFFAVHRVETADEKAIESRMGRKLPLGKRIILKLVEKKARKYQKKNARARIKDTPDNLATFALVLGVLTYVLLAIPTVAFLSFFVAIGAVIAGILALKRGGNKLRSILGIVLGGLFVSLIIISLIIFLSAPPGG
ncbi:MAG: hypothetical protein J5I94_23710 [Phaeodactylibacter sp.]|nr:hypothetical protein [Phaeodactylibacter sp.]